MELPSHLSGRSNFFLRCPHPACLIKDLPGPLRIRFTDFQRLEPHFPAVPVDDILVVDVQIDMVESRNLLRKQARSAALHLFQMARSIDDLVKSNSVLAEKRTDIPLRTEG